MINHSAALAVLVQNMGALLVIICLVQILHSPRYTAILHFKRLQILENSGKIPTKDRDSSKLRQMHSLLCCHIGRLCRTFPLWPPEILSIDHGALQQVSESLAGWSVHVGPIPTHRSPIKDMACPKITRQEPEKN